MSRTISRKDVTPPPEPGFIGEGHTAVEVLRPTALAKSDPFVLLMDDRFDIPKRRQIGGAHPHAGLETVTLVLEGSLHDRDEGTLDAGDMLWMTAGRGIIHSESVEAFGQSRILQLWIALPARDRALEPGFELVRKNEAPSVRAPGVAGRLYSGSSGELRSSTRNRVPVTMMELAFEPGASFAQELSASYNGFVYVIEGKVDVGGTSLVKGDVGWLAPSDSSTVSFAAGEHGARLVLYAGEPIQEPLMQHGPFVAGSPQEIMRYHQLFRAGQFTSMSRLAQQAQQQQ